MARTDRRRLRPPRVARQALGQEHCDDGQPRGSVACQHPEDGAPAPARQQLSSDERRQDRGEAHDQHEGGQRANRRLLVEVIPHDGPRDDQGRAPSQRLQEPARNQHLDARRQCARHRRQREDQQSQVERGFAAHPIGQRTVERLPARDADEVGGQAHLDQPGCGVQVSSDGRQRRQVHVDGQWAHGGQPAEDDHGPEIVRPRRWRADGRVHFRR